MNNVVDTILNSLGTYWPSGEDIIRHQVPHLLLGPDLIIGLLDRLIQPVYIFLIAGARRILEELDVDNTSETDTIKSPQGVGVVPNVPGAFGDIRIFKDRFKSPAVI